MNKMDVHAVAFSMQPVSSVCNLKESWHFSQSPDWPRRSKGRTRSLHAVGLLVSELEAAGRWDGTASHSAGK